MINKVTTDEPPRQILFEHFKSMGCELPISGGWGYTKEDAVVIDKNDPVVDRNVPFNGVGIEYIFVEKRIYEELIIFRSKDDRYAGIEWNRMAQETFESDGRQYDKLTFKITGYHEKDWDKLKAEWESPNGVANPDFNIEAHQNKRENLKIQYEREYWFDITSFYGYRT